MSHDNLVLARNMQHELGVDFLSRHTYVNGLTPPNQLPPFFAVGVTELLLLALNQTFQDYSGSPNVRHRRFLPFIF